MRFAENFVLTFKNFLREWNLVECTDGMIYREIDAYGTKVGPSKKFKRYWQLHLVRSEPCSMNCSVQTQKFKLYRRKVFIGVTLMSRRNFWKLISGTSTYGSIKQTSNHEFSKVFIATPISYLLYKIWFVLMDSKKSYIIKVKFFAPPIKVTFAILKNFTRTSIRPVENKIWYGLVTVLKSLNSIFKFGIYKWDFYLKHFENIYPHIYLKHAINNLVCQGELQEVHNLIPQRNYFSKYDQEYCIFSTCWPVRNESLR